MQSEVTKHIINKEHSRYNRYIEMGLRFIITPVRAYRLFISHISGPTMLTLEYNLAELLGCVKVKQQLKSIKKTKKNIKKKREASIPLHE